MCVVVRVFFYVLCLYARERNFGEEKSKIFCKNPKKTERRIEERHPFLSERDERLGTFGDKKKSRLHAHGEKSTMSSREEEITRIHNEELLLQLFSLSLFSKQSEELFRFFIFRFGVLIILRARSIFVIFPRLGVSFRLLYFFPSLFLYSPYLFWLYLRTKSTQGFDDGDFVVVVAALLLLSLLLLLNSGRDQRGGSGEQRRRHRDCFLSAIFL